MKLPIPADWDGESWCRWAICWPDSEAWEAILRGFVTLPQRGWTWDERTGSIIAIQEVGREITAANLPLNGVFMACNDTQMVAAFNSIAAALSRLADAQCCDNLQIDNSASFQGVVTSPGGSSVPIFGSEPPLGIEPGEFPPEFETEEAYLLSKCKMANYVADGLIGSLRAMSNLTIAQFTMAIIATILLMAGAIVFPPSAFPALMIALGILGGATGLLYVAATKLEENRDEFVCLLYEGNNAGAVIGTISDFFDTIIALVGTTTVLGAAIKAILMLFMNTDTLNALFDGRATSIYPDASCAGCSDNPWEYNDGNEWLPTPYDPETELYTLPARPTGPKWRGDLRIVGGACQHITELNKSNFTDDGAAGFSAYATCAAPTTFINLPKPHDVDDLPAELAYYAPWSTTEFTITFKSEDAP